MSRKRDTAPCPPTGGLEKLKTENEKKKEKKEKSGY